MQRSPPPGSGLPTPLWGRDRGRPPCLGNFPARHCWAGKRHPAMDWCCRQAGTPARWWQRRRAWTAVLWRQQKRPRTPGGQERVGLAWQGLHRRWPLHWLRRRRRRPKACVQPQPWRRCCPTLQRPTVRHWPRLRRRWQTARPSCRRGRRVPPRWRPRCAAPWSQAPRLLWRWAPLHWLRWRPAQHPPVPKAVRLGKARAGQPQQPTCPRLHRSQQTARRQRQCRAATPARRRCQKAPVLLML